MKDLKRILVAIGLIVLLVSCDFSQPNIITPTSLIDTEYPSVSSSPVPSLASTLTITQMQKPTIRPSETKLPLLTETIQPTATRDVTVTVLEVEQEQAEDEIKQLFQDHGACPPPCYLGVIPGQTTSNELRNIFKRWGIQLNESIQHKSSFYIEHRFASGYLLNASFIMKDDIVESIGFIVNQDETNEWSAYAPTALLERQGVPSHVSFWIGSIHEPSPTPWKGWYYMIMSYEELELHIEYGGVEIRLDEIATVCPHSDPYDYGRVWLGQYPEFLPPPHVTYLEEATSLSLDVFHDYLLIGPGACFFLDANKVAHL